MQAETKFLFATVKLIEYIFSEVSACSNPCVGPFPRIKMPFYFIIHGAEEIISMPKIITLMPNSPPGKKTFSLLSNPIP